MGKKATTDLQQRRQAGSHACGAIMMMMDAGMPAARRGTIISDAMRGQAMPRWKSAIRCKRQAQTMQVRGSRASLTAAMSSSVRRLEKDLVGRGAGARTDRGRALLAAAVLVVPSSPLLVLVLVLVRRLPAALPSLSRKRKERDRGGGTEGRRRSAGREGRMWCPGQGRGRGPPGGRLYGRARLSGHPN